MVMKNNLPITITAKNNTGTAFASLRSSLGKIKGAIFNVQTAIAGIAGATGFGLLIKSTVQTNREFQSLEASLKTFLGSADNASKAFEVLQVFAAKTPFALKEVVGSFNKLIAVGLKPSIKTMVAFGNITSGVGKSLDQFVEAAADAAVGEFERLKEFGIKAKTEGDKVSFTFKGMTTTVQKSSEAITGYLVGLGETQFAGAMAEQTKTLNGAFSNLGDSFDTFKKAIGEAGFNQALIEVSRFFGDMMQSSNGLATSIGQFLASGVRLIPAMFTNIGRAADFVSRNIDFLRRSLIAVTSYLFAKAMLGQALAFIKFGSSLLKAQKAMILYRAAQKMLMYGTLTVIAVIASMTDNLDRVINAVKFAADESMKLAEKAFPGLTDAVNKLLPNLDSLEAGLEKDKNEAHLTGNAIAALDAQLAALMPDMEKTTEKTDTLAESLKKLKEKGNEVQEGLGNAAVRGVKSLEDALVDVTMGAASAKDAFKNMARSIISDLIRIQIQQTITKPLAAAMGGGNFLSTIGSALFGGGKAIGGSVRANTPYMVGERGAEMFVPNSSGSIVPNNKLGGGGVTVNQTINLSAGVSQTVRAEVMGMLPQIQEASKAAVLDARRRGGSFSAAFG